MEHANQEQQAVEQTVDTPVDLPHPDFASAGVDDSYNYAKGYPESSEVTETPAVGAPTAPAIIRVLHVQVTGNPDQAKLQQVADAFKLSLQSGQSEAVITDASVTSRIEYQATEAMPVDLVHVRASMTPAEVIAIAYQASNAGEGPHWNELEEKARLELIRLGLDCLNIGGFQEGEENVITGASVFKATISALLPYIVTPSDSQEVKAWSGETNLRQDSAWATLPFQGLRAGMIFQMEGHPGKYFSSVSNPYVQYDALTAKLSIAVDEAVVAGTKPLDENDFTKGFTLTWKPVEQKSQDEDTSAESSTEEAVEDDVPGLTPEQDPTVITDVEVKESQG